MKYPKITAIVNSFKRYDLLNECLISLTKSSYPNLEVIVVDIGTNKIVDLMKCDHPNIVVHCFKIDKGPVFQRNYGFSKISEDSKYVVFIDNDIELTANCLEELVTIMEGNPQYGIVQALQLVPETVQTVNCSGGFMDKAGFPFAPNTVPRHILDRYLRLGKSPIPITYAAGFVFTRVSIMRKLQSFGPWPNDYFHHFEDVDLSWKTKLLGYEVVMHPQARVYHKGGNTQRSAHLVPAYDVFINTRNRFHTLLKHFNLGNVIRYLTLSILLEFARAIHLLFINPKHGLAIMKGIFWLVQKYPSIYKEHLAIQRIRLIPDHKILEGMPAVNLIQLIRSSQRRYI